jgi:CBS domain-containing protein
MKVADRMIRDPKTIAPDETIRRAAKLMDEFAVGALPVCDGGRLVGIVTDRDIAIRAVALGCPPDSTNVSEVMTKGVKCLPPDSDIVEAGEVMAAARVRRLPIVDGEQRLVGILSLDDLTAPVARELSAVLQAMSQRSVIGG